MFETLRAVPLLAHLKAATFERLNQSIGRVKRKLNRCVRQCTVINTQNGVKLRKRLRQMGGMHLFVIVKPIKHGFGETRLS